MSGIRFFVLLRNAREQAQLVPLLSMSTAKSGIHALYLVLKPRLLHTYGYEMN